ncbi:MAG TPA: hypothetical protein V6C81_22360 [Planktothrix sp.]|jgi:hypothetical protein
MFSPSFRKPALLSLASTLLLALPAFSQVITGSVAANGDLFDTNGNLIGHCNGPVTKVMTPVVVPNNSITTVGPTSTVTRSEELTPGGTITTYKKTVTTTDDVLPIATTTIRTYQMNNVLCGVLDARRLVMERQMGNSILPEVVQMKADLAQIYAGELAARNSGTLDYASALSLAARMDEINNRFFAVTGVGRLTPLVMFDSAGNRQIAVTNLSL